LHAFEETSTTQPNHRWKYTMNANQISFASIEQVGKRAVGAMRKVLLWFVGLPADAILAHRTDVQMRYTSAGLLVCAWYIFMLITWIKTGLYFFGVGGAIAFALIPTIMLAVDRMILGQPRNPDGDLAAYAIDELKPKRWEYALRMLAALSFSVVTTLVFLITHSSAEIRARQQLDQQASNAPLRVELVGRMDAQVSERMRSIINRTAELEAQASFLREDHAASRKVAEEAESRMRGAQFNLAAELGGIEGRHMGAGPRHDAYQLIARQNQDAAVNARARETRARETLAKLQAVLNQLNSGRERVTTNHTGAMANIEADMSEDVRYVSRKQGLFADATTLIKLYGDGDVGPGLALTSFLTALLLFVLEMSPLLGLAFLPRTPFDVERIALNRGDAARIVAEHEIGLMQAASRRAARVRPATAAEAAEAPLPGEPALKAGEVNQ